MITRGEWFVFRGGTMKWFLAVLALLYALIPFDVLPDFLTGLGWLDDLLLAGLIWYFFFKRAGTPTEQAGPDAHRGAQGDHRQARNGRAEKSAGSQAESDPYRILGVPSDASQEEIRAAYRRLAARYHPDKVAHLGEEFQAVAEKKFKALQAAYDTLREGR